MKAQSSSMGPIELLGEVWRASHSGLITANTMVNRGEDGGI